MSLIRSRLRAFCADTGGIGKTAYILMANGRSMPLRELVRTRKGWERFVESLAQGMPSLLRLSIRDATIRIKNNARLVYADRERNGRLLAAKIALPSKVRSGSLAREIKARKFLARHAAGVPVPALLRYDRTSLLWLEEEYIETASAEPGHMTELFLTRWAVDVYSPSARSRLLSQYLSIRKVSFRELDEVFREVGQAFPDRFETSRWPVALLHGDLSYGNMIVDRTGQLFIIDWEKFGRGPIAWDLRELFLVKKGLVLETIAALNGRHDVHPKIQMAVALSLELILRRRSREEQSEYFAQRRGISQASARELVLKREENLLASLSGLVPAHRQSGDVRKCGEP